MSERGRSERKTLALALYLLAALGALACVAMLFLIRDNVRRNASTGDYAGAGLGTAFLGIILLPVTLIALVLALWLSRWGPRAVEIGAVTPADPAAPTASASPPPASPSRHARPGLALALALAGLLPLAAVGVLLTSALRGAITDYHLRGADLLRLALQDVVVFSPLLALSGLCFWIAAVVARPGRGRKG